MSEQDHNLNVVCPNCEGRINVLHELAGHKAVCPHCGEAVTITEHVIAPDPPAEGEAIRSLKDGLHAHRHCPVCEAPVEESARVCVSCGYDLVEGRHIHTEFKEEKSRGALLRRLVTAVAIAVLAYALYRVILRYL